MIRVVVEGPPGEVARSPEEALSALADIAEADGAIRAEWLEKALVSGGAVAREVKVSGESPYRIVEDVAERAERIYQTAMHLARMKIRERIEQAVREADTEAYRKLLQSG